MLKTTYNQNNICSNNICSKQHLLKTTFSQKNIYSKQHQLKTTWAQTNIFSKQHLLKNICSKLILPKTTLAPYSVKRSEVDLSLLRLSVSAPRISPKVLMFLELGLQPVPFILMSRRLMLLQYILKKDPRLTLHRFFKLNIKIGHKAHIIIGPIQFQSILT